MLVREGVWYGTAQKEWYSMYTIHYTPVALKAGLVIRQQQQQYIVYTVYTVHSTQTSTVTVQRPSYLLWSLVCLFSNLKHGAPAVAVALAILQCCHAELQ